MTVDQLLNSTFIQTLKTALENKVDIAIVIDNSILKEKAFDSMGTKFVLLNIIEGVFENYEIKSDGIYINFLISSELVNIKFTGKEMTAVKTVLRGDLLISRADVIPDARPKREMVFKMAGEEEKVFII